MVPERPLPPTVQLRPARPDDFPAITRLLAEHTLPLDGVREALPNFVVAMDGEDLIGVAGLEICRDNAVFRSLAVASRWRSRGLGRALVSRLIADAEARGIGGLYLLTTTAEKYFPAFGFRPIARDEVADDVRATAEFRGACPASAMAMYRPSLPGTPLLP